MMKLKMTLFSPVMISGLYKVSTGKYRLFTTLGHDVEICEEAAQEILDFFEKHPDELHPRK